MNYNTDVLFDDGDIALAIMQGEEEAFKIAQNLGMEDNVSVEVARRAGEVLLDVLNEVNEHNHPAARLAELFAELVAMMEAKSEVGAQATKDLNPGDLLVVSEDDPIFKMMGLE